MKHTTTTTLAALAALTAAPTAVTGCRHDFGAESGGARRGEQAQLFKSVNEDLQPVDMKQLTDGRPLVLAVGSAS